MSVQQIAQLVAERFPGPVQIENRDNPRVEAPEHYYNVTHTGLVELGLQPHLLSQTLIESMFPIVEQNKHRADPDKMQPRIQWASAKN